MENARSIVVRAPQWLGDAIVATIFLDRLKKRFPSATLSVLAPPGVAPIYEGLPEVSEVIRLPTPASEIRRRNFDVAYILPRSLRTALEMALARVPRRIGYAGDFRRLLLTDAVPYDPSLLYAHRYLRLIGEEALPLADIQPRFPEARPDAETQRALFGRLAADLPRPILGVGPASVAPSRTWPAERFAAVARQFLKETNGSVLVFGSPAEAAVAERIAAAAGSNAINTAGKINLPQLGWAMNLCDAVVVNDSGLMHVAAAFGKEGVVVFGASDPRFALPPSGRMMPLQRRDLFCVPCLRNHCVRFGAGQIECLKSIGADAVMDLLRPRMNA